MQQQWWVLCAVARDADRSPLNVSSYESRKASMKPRAPTSSVVLAALGIWLWVACTDQTPTANDGGMMDSAIDVATTDVPTDVPLEASGDSGPVAACDLSKPFGTPVLVPGAINSAGNNTSTWFLPDELTVFLTSNRVDAGGSATGDGHGPGYNVYAGTRSDVDAAFTTLVPSASMNGVATGAGSEAPTLTADGLTVYFTTGDVGSYVAWTATRTSTAVDFDKPSEVSAPINGTGTENSPSWVTPDGGTLYLMSNRSGTRDIYTATRAGGGGFNAPVALASVNSTMNESAIILTPDELQAIVDRGGYLFYASRTTTADGFSTPVPITELNAFSYPIGVTWLSADGCTVYFDGPEPDGGPYAIYAATRGQ